MNNPTRSQADHEILNLLEEMKSSSMAYPPELLARRRAAFIEKLEELAALTVEDSRSLDDEAMIEVLGGLQHHDVKYPPLLLARQRAAFLNQAAKHRKRVWTETFSSAIRNWFTYRAKSLTESMTTDLRRSLIVLSLLVAAFAGIFLFREGNQSAGLSGAHLALREVLQPTYVIPVPTDISKVTKTTCTPDSPSASSCVIDGFAQSRDRTSWVSKTANNWIKIDMGRSVTINRVEMDRKNSDNATGDFTIAVAQSDGQYEKVYDSRVDHPASTGAGPETMRVSFEPVLARYVKVTVIDPGIVIQGVTAFSMVPPPTSAQTNKEEDPQVSSPPTLKSTSTPLPTSTPIPSDTPAPTDTLWPTNTPSLTDTPWLTNTPLPTDTLWPTSTPLPTNTPWPTSTPMPTDTLWPTSTPVPIDTPTPILLTSQVEYISPTHGRENSAHRCGSSGQAATAEVCVDWP